MKAFLQKGIIAFLLVLLVGSMTTKPVFAGSAEEDGPLCWKVGEKEYGLCLQYWVHSVVTGAEVSIITQGAGAVPGVNVTKEEWEQEQKDLQEGKPGGYIHKMDQRSFVAKADRVIMAVYQNPPATTSIAAIDIGKTLGFIPEKAFAQGPGIGFSGLSPLLPIWKVFRNIAYFLLAIVMVVIGFMVMFRQKIDPKTVVTVQNALPRVIVALLLITFSYAIVGILIDVMYLSIVLIASLLIPAGKSLVGDDNFNSVTVATYLSADWLTVFGQVLWGGWRTLDDVVAFMGGGGVGVLAAVSVGGALLGITGLINPFVATGIFTVSILAILLVVLILIFGVLRLLFILLSAYIQIIIALLTAPLQLLAVAVPGNNAFQSWIMNLISNLIVFPITAALLLIATILSSYEKDPTGLATAGHFAEGQAPSLWGPPFLTSAYHGMAGLIALGILLSIPTIVNSIKEAFKAKPAIPVGGTAPFVGIAGTASTYGFQYMMAKWQSAELAKTMKNLPQRTEQAGGTRATSPEAGGGHD